MDITLEYKFPVAGKEEEFYYNTSIKHVDVIEYFKMEGKYSNELFNFIDYGKLASDEYFIQFMNEKYRSLAVAEFEHVKAIDEE